MRRVHLPLLEQSMQSNRQSPVALEIVTGNESTSDKMTLPIVLDAAVLGQVAGGLSPKGTWAADSMAADTTDSPKGTW